MRKLSITLLVLAMVGAVAFPASADSDARPAPVRFATFNASLNRANAGDLVTELDAAASGDVAAQLQAVLDIIAINDPDVLLVNEFDYDDAEKAAELFAGLAGYEYWFTDPSNTGIPSGFDLDNDGATDGPGDAYGFGFFPGQFGMLVLSKYPIGNVRTFQNFRWIDMPGALLPELDGESWYSDEELDGFRLSSKSHWDVGVRTPQGVVRFLVSHPTPPVFDGDEDRNGLRNHDEIRFWADYINPRASRYIYDDNGRRGGIRSGSFVIAGDLNADPFDGDSASGAASQLTEHPRINNSAVPSSDGAVEQSALQGSNNADHLGNPAYDTADFGEAEFGGPGNLRVDYVLASRRLTISDAAVFWPTTGDPDFGLVGVFPFPSSDHRLVWVDLTRSRG